MIIEIILYYEKKFEIIIFFKIKVYFYEYVLS